MGCKECEFRVMKYGETQCLNRPHDYVTPEQVAIVGWLSAPLRDAWTDAGCPGFKQWSPTRPPSAG